MTEITRVYVDMVADLFHYGHVNFLRQAKSHGDFLLVAVHSDETVESLTQLASLHQTVSCTYELNPRCNITHLLQTYRLFLITLRGSINAEKRLSISWDASP